MAASIRSRTSTRPRSSDLALRNEWKPACALGPSGRRHSENIITKPPTAELRENQKDQDSLPPYDDPRSHPGAAG
jgi:hypothetical protein